MTKGRLGTRTDQKGKISLLCGPLQSPRATGPMLSSKQSTRAAKIYISGRCLHDGLVGIPASKSAVDNQWQTIESYPTILRGYTDTELLFWEVISICVTVFKQSNICFVGNDDQWLSWTGISVSPASYNYWEHRPWFYAQHATTHDILCLTA